MSGPSYAADLEAPRREALRAELCGKLSPYYSPWLHLAFPSFVGIGLIATAICLIQDLRPLELLLIPIVWVVSNATEWRVHRDVLHKRQRFLEVIFDRHTPEHHGIYVEHDMAIRSTREFALVLIPAYGILLIFLQTFPFTAALWLLGYHNLSALFVVTTMFYVVSYEWLHLSYHLPPESFVGRMGIIRAMKKHHARHHRPELMQKWNFNVNVPLWDWVRGTIHRDPAEQVAVTKPSLSS
jgi:hypothetical protein